MVVGTALRCALRLGCLLLAGWLGSGVAIAAEPVKISVNNHHYDAMLHENGELVEALHLTPELLHGAHFRGQLEQHPDSWVRISRVNERWQGLVSISGDMFVVDMMDEAILSEAGVPVIVARPVSDFRPVACGCGGHQQPQQAKAMLAPVHSAMQLADQVQFSSLCENKIDGVCLLAELEVVFDQQFQQDLGNDARDQATSLINMVEGYYRNDLSVIFDTLTVEFLDSVLFSTTTNAGDLLEDISNKRRLGQLPFVKSNSSLVHLVTGRDFDGGTAGIAYVDVLCRRSGLGTTELLNNFNGTPSLSLTALVMAHELGHNFGASHDGDGNNCGGGFIMAATVNSSAQGFSDCSVTSMQNSISNLSNPASCFNFPVDLTLVADNANPSSADAGQEVILNYDVQTSVAFQSVSGLRVSGSVPSDQGRFNTVTLNGNGCTVANDRLSYQCDLNNPAASASLEVRVESVANATQLTVSNRVEESNSPETKDILPDNNDLETALPVVRVIPSAPSNLVVSQVGDDARLSWTDNSDSETGFRIERQVGSGSFAVLDNVSQDVISYTDSSVQPGTRYTYRVIATGAGGDSAASGTAAITPVISTPSAPGNVSVTQGSGTRVSVRWQDNSNNETGFRVERRSGGGAFSSLGSTAANVTSFTDTTSSASVTYDYRVIAFNGSGDSAASANASITPTAPSTGGGSSGSSGGGGGGGGGGGSTGWPLLAVMSLLLWWHRRTGLQRTRQE